MIPDELKKLADLHASGALSDEEFRQAKAKLLSEATERKPTPYPQPPQRFMRPLPFREENDDSMGQAANRYVTFQMISSIVGGIIFLFIFLTFIAPSACSHSGSSFGSPGNFSFPR